MLKQPKTALPAKHDGARLPTTTAGIQSKVNRNTTLSNEPPTVQNMEQKSGTLVPGGRVVFLSRSGLHRGILKYVGRVQFGEGEWCGVELDKPEEGCHGGAVNDVEYFQCEESRGVFVERWKVCREGQEEDIKSADAQCSPLPSKTSLSPENEARLPQLKFKSKIPSSLKSKTMKSSSSSAMTPLRVTTVLDVANSTEGQVHVRTFVDLRGSDVELRGQQAIKEIESLTGGGDRSDDRSGNISLQHHYSNVKSIRRSQSRGNRSSVNHRTNDGEAAGVAIGAEIKGTIPLFLPDGENSGRGKPDRSSLCPTGLPSQGKDCLVRDEFSEGHLKNSEQTGHTKRQMAEVKDDLSLPDVSSDDLMTSMREVNSEIEGFQSDNEDLSTTGCCIQSFISLYNNHSLKESHSVVADDSRSSAKLSLCQRQSSAELGSVYSGVNSQTDHSVMTSAQDDSTQSKASMPDVIGTFTFSSKIPRPQKMNNDDDDGDEFGDADYLAASQTSLASSLGILNDSDILEDTCFLPEGFAGKAGHLHEQSEDQPKQEDCLAEVSMSSHLQSTSESAHRSDEIMSRGCDDQPVMTEGEIAAAAGVASSDDVLHVEIEGHSTVSELTKNPETFISSSFHLDSAEYLESEVDESLSDVHNVHQTDSENCAENIFLDMESSDENVTLRETETSDLAATVQKICIDTVEKEDVEDDEDENLLQIVEKEDVEDDEDQGLSKIVEKVDVEDEDNEDRSLSKIVEKVDVEDEDDEDRSLSKIVEKVDVEDEDDEDRSLSKIVEKVDVEDDEDQGFSKIVETEDVEDDEDQGLSKIVVQVELERQLVDRQEHRLSYDDPSDVSDQLCKQVSSGQLDVMKSSSSHSTSSEVAVTDKESSSPIVFEETHRQSVGQVRTHQEVEITQGGVGLDGGGSSMGSKTKLIKTVHIQSRQLSTLDEKNEDSKQMPLDAKVEKEANRQRRPEDKRQQLSAGRPRVAADAEKPSAKGVSSGHRYLGRFKSFDAASSQMPAISTLRTGPSVGENAPGGLSVNHLRRNRVASLDLGNTSSSSSSSSLKRSGIRRETLRETNVCEPTNERMNTGILQNGKTQIATAAAMKTATMAATKTATTAATKTATTAATKRRPSLLLHQNSSYTSGRTYAAVVKNNKTPSDSNLFDSETVVTSNIQSRRTSTPLPSAEDPASCSSSMSLENSHPGLQEKKQLSVLANKRGLKNQSLVISSKSKTTNAGKCGQLKLKIDKRNERNSDGKTNSKQEQDWHLQQHHQPDLVPNADAKDREMDEIIRLEQMCESRLQQLNHLNTEVQCRTKWFQALVIVVQQLSQRLDSEDRNGLRCRLNESLEQLDSMRKQLQELMKQRDALIDEIQSVKEEEEQEREALKQEHQVQLSDLKEALQRQYEESLYTALDDHSKKIAAAEANHQQEISELKESHEQTIAKNQEDHKSSLKAQISEHDSILQELKNQQDRQLGDITLRFEHIKLSLSEKVECLRSECEEMRRREATYMESCQMEMEQKLHLALLPYRHLPQEIESLKAVLELRNLELRDLRHHNHQLQRQVEELPAAQETIKKFQQKVENLEAVIKIRTDYERQLSEKHQQLLRRYDRESKANKRLSMDKEELLWRLSSSQTLPTEHPEASTSPSFDTFQRSLSHYLATASDCAGGVNPEGDARIGGVSETASSSSFLSTSPVASRLHRSGTYDLLCDVLDDEKTQGSLTSPSE